MQYVNLGLPVTLAILLLSFLKLASTSNQSTFDSISDLSRLSELPFLLKIIDYYKQNMGKFNLDGVFGLHVLSGHFKSLSELVDIQLLEGSSNFQDDLRNAAEKAQVVLEQSMQALKSDPDSEYVHSMIKLFDKQWDVYFPQRNFSGKFLKRPPDYEYKKFAGEKSDACMQEIIGNTNLSKCSFSRSCLDMMSSNEYRRYELNHHLLFSILARLHGCESKLDSLYRDELQIEDGLQEVISTQSANLLADMLSVIQRDSRSNLMEDLFLEQVFIGLTLGFEQFLAWPVQRLVRSLFDQRLSCFSGTLQEGSEQRFEDEASVLKDDSDQIEDHFDLEPNVELDDDTNEKFEPGVEDKLYVDSHVNSRPNDVDDEGDDYNDDRDFNDFEEADDEDDDLLEKGNEHYTMKRSQATGRHLLVEVEMPDGCLSHKTAVGSGALILLLRWRLTRPEAFARAVKRKADVDTGDRDVLDELMSYGNHENDWHKLGRDRLAPDKDYEDQEEHPEVRRFQMRRMPGAVAPSRAYILIFLICFVVLLFICYHYARKVRVRIQYAI